MRLDLKHLRLDSFEMCYSYVRGNHVVSNWPAGRTTWTNPNQNPNPKLNPSPQYNRK